MDGPTLQVLIVAGVLIWGWCRLRALFGGTTGRYVAGHSHSGSLRGVATHEAGHAVAARKLGGKRISGRVAPDGSSGYVDATFDSGDDRTDRINAAAFLLAGGAAGRRVGGRYDESDHDTRLAKRNLRGTGVTLGQARRRARQVIPSGAVNSTARRFERTGRLG